MLGESLGRERSQYSQTPHSTAPKIAEQPLLERFNRHFRTVSADTPDLIRLAQELRYQVYCIEHQFENPADHPDGREKDKFDGHSVHSLLIHRSTGQAVGTVRLVLPRRDAPEESFAIQRTTRPSVLAASHLPIHTTGEVSRFSISKRFRDSKTEEGSDLRRLGPLMSLGLMQAIVSMSARHGLTHWCAVMEPKLLRMLTSMAIQFISIGAPVEYHGIRQPCYGHITTVLDRVRREQPMFWQILTQADTLEGRALAA